MDSTASKKIRTYKEIKKLKADLSEAQRELKQAATEYEKEDLKEYVNYLEMELGWRLIDCGDYESGLILYQSLPSKTHGEYKANGTARALLEMKKFDEARKTLVEGLKQYAKSSCLWNTLGNVLLELNNELEALKCFRVALKFASPEGKASILYNKSLVFNRLGYYEDAEEILGELIKNNPNNPDYLIEMGYCSLNRGDSNHALEWFLKAKALGHSSPEVFDGLYCAYTEMNLLNESLEVALRGLQEFPEIPRFYELVGHAYMGRNWFNDSKDIIEIGLKKFPDDEGLKELLEKVGDKIDDPPDGGELLGLLLIVTALLAHKKFKRR
jgi:Flp pilus assembly protein TadD